MTSLFNIRSKKIFSLSFGLSFFLFLALWVIVGVYTKNTTFISERIRLFLLFGGASLILIFSYLLVSLNKEKGNIFVLLALVFSTLSTILLLFGIIGKITSDSSLWNGDKSNLKINYILLIILIILTALKTLNVYSGFAGFNNYFGKFHAKYIFYISCIINAIALIIFMGSNFIHLYDYYLEIVMFDNLSRPQTVGIITFIFEVLIIVYTNFVLFLFMKNYEFKTYIYSNITTIKRHLNLLKEEYELGLINQEDYQKRRQDIINQI